MELRDDLMGELSVSTAPDSSPQIKGVKAKDDKKKPIKPQTQYTVPDSFLQSIFFLKGLSLLSICANRLQTRLMMPTVSSNCFLFFFQWCKTHFW